LKPNISETIKEIKAEKFDLIIDLHNNLRTRLIKLACGIPSKTFIKLNFKKFLLTALKINILPHIHIVDRYFKATSGLGVVNDGEGLDYFSPSSKEELENINSVFSQSQFVAMAIGGQHFTKRMPVSKLSKIIEGTHSIVILLGGKDDILVAIELESLYPENVINLVGKLTLHQSAGVIKMASLLVTHDTGMMHIAAALKIPVVAIWGNTIPEFGMYPYYGNKEISYFNFEVKGLACRPCSKIGYRHCPKKHFNCMNLQDIEKILEVINRIG